MGLRGIHVENQMFGPQAAPLVRLAPLALLCAAGYAQAQVIEEVELRREGNNAIVQVRFTVPVQ
jgi:hypothetical protein